MVKTPRETAPAPQEQESKSMETKEKYRSGGEKELPELAEDTAQMETEAQEDTAKAAGKAESEREKAMEMAGQDVEQMSEETFKKMMKEQPGMPKMDYNYFSKLPEHLTDMKTDLAKEEEDLAKAQSEAGFFGRWFNGAARSKISDIKAEIVALKQGIEGAGEVLRKAEAFAELEADRLMNAPDADQESGKAIDRKGKSRARQEEAARRGRTGFGRQ